MPVQSKHEVGVGVRLTVQEFAELVGHGLTSDVRELEEDEGFKTV